MLSDMAKVWCMGDCGVSLIKCGGTYSNYLSCMACLDTVLVSKISGWSKFCSMGAGTKKK